MISINIVVFLQLISRSFLALAFISLLYFALVLFVKRAFVDNYSYLDVNHCEVDTKPQIEKRHLLSPEDSVIDSDFESESEDIITPFLDHNFYKNLNNSSQYLRRDSFSQ
mgnify:CR=1 FL=1